MKRMPPFSQFKVYVASLPNNSLREHGVKRLIFPKVSKNATVSVTFISLD